MAPDVVLLTTSEVAHLLRISEATVRRWAEEGRLDEVPTPGRDKRFRKAQIDAILAGDHTAAGAAGEAMS